MQTPCAFDGHVSLAHWGVIRATGADAATFLHSQLTNDVAQLGTSQARWAGFCSAKGRLQASFLVWRAGAEDVFLACAADLLPAVLKRLSMFVLRAKCKLSDASGELRLVGAAGASAQHSLGDAEVLERRDFFAGSSIRLPDAAGCPRALWALPVAADLPSDSLELAHWRWLEVQSGLPVIEAATVDRFVPQMLNFELLGGVDFRKGCYPGQEVVARSQYRGTIKRRMALFDLRVECHAGQEVFHSEDPEQPAGMVVNAASVPHDGGWSALVEIKLAALEQGSLHLGSAQGAALTRAELPYPVPLASETI